MRKSWLQIVGGVALLLVMLVVGLRAQDQKSPSPEEQRKAINLVRAINTAEVRYSSSVSHGRFASWSELYDSGLLKGLELSAGPEVMAGYRLDLLASADGKSFMVGLHDTKDGDGLFSVFSDQTGIIFLGAPPR